MNIVVEKQPNCAAKLRAEIPAEVVRERREKIVLNYAAKARVPGYRPGKAPQALIYKRFEKAISEELHEQLVNEAFDQAVQQEKLKVLDFGSAEDLAAPADGGLSFVINLTLAPEFQLPEYKGISVTVPPVEVPEEDLQAQLKELQERHADFTDVEGRAAAMGDFAVIDYSSTVNGMPTEEFLGKPAGYLSGREGFWLRLDEKAFLPGFAAQVAGMTPGESREIAITLPDDFPMENLRNVEMRFSVSLKELKQAVLPELNDELADRLLPGKTMQEITDLVLENMQQERKRRIDDEKVGQIIAHLNSLLNFELPDDLVTQETQSQADTMVQRGIQAGMSEEEIEAQQAEIFDSAGHQARTNLRTNFILQEIARIENITVSDAELVTHLARVAESRKQAPKKFIKEMQRAGRLPSVRQSITIGKTIDLLLSEAIVTESAEAAETAETPA